MRTARGGSSPPFGTNFPMFHLHRTLIKQSSFVSVPSVRNQSLLVFDDRWVALEAGSARGWKWFSLFVWMPEEEFMRVIALA